MVFWRHRWFYLSCLAAFTAGHMINYGVVMYAQEAIRLDWLSGVGFGLCFGPPLLLATFPAAALLKLDGGTLLQLLLGLAIGTPALAALAVLTSALTLGLRGAGALAGLVMLPLAVPLLIFGAGALGDHGMGAVKLLAATALLLTAIIPFAAGAALRAARE